jgi:ribonuclease E
VPEPSAETAEVAPAEETAAEQVEPVEAPAPVAEQVAAADPQATEPEVDHGGVSVSRRRRRSASRPAGPPVHTAVSDG